MKTHWKPLQLGPIATLMTAILLSGAFTVLCLWCQPNRLLEVTEVLTAQPLLIVLNALPVGLLILAFTFLFHNVFASAAVVGGCCAALSVANRIKIEVRNEPVVPRDLALIKEVYNAASSYDIHWPKKVIVVILAAVLLTAAAAVFIRCKPFPSVLKRWWGRVLACLACLAVLFGLVKTVYASDKLFNSFHTTNSYNFTIVFNELGFPYCFTHNATTYTVDKPEGYSRSEAMSWETGDATGLGEKVHVIMVMDEAFSALTDEPVFRFAEGDDPLANLHALQNDPHAITGRLVVPGFAGGTANTEFDVLTGMQTNALSANTTSALRAVNRNLDSLFRVFGADGYRTSFFHPGDDWFYNRENVYRWLGAETTRFIDEMQNIRYKGWWPSDDYMAQQIEEEFETAVANGQYLFNYTTTIQNHMSYVATKYGEDYTFAPVSTSASHSEAVQTMVDVYVDGLRDADAMLGRLQNYFASQNEPVILVFFGDHLPYLGGNQLGYTELGSEVSLPEPERSDAFCSYETPYVIWANDSAAQALDWETAVPALSLSEDGRLSACYLGSTVLELTGRDGESPWFTYLNTMRRQMPVIQKKLCLTADGTVQRLDESAEELQQAVAKNRRWAYYKLKQKEVG